MWRIPGLLGETSNEALPPILLQHGLECDMMMWVVNSPEVAPAFVLAREGYDVWMGNNRGNRFSDKHATLNPKSSKYWDFDWEDMGTKDTPAMLDYILSKTGNTKMSYIGHSEGTTQIMAGASLIPEYYNNKLNVGIFLAPPASMKNNNEIFLNLLALKINRLLIGSFLETI